MAAAINTDGRDLSSTRDLFLLILLSLCWITLTPILVNQSELARHRVKACCQREVLSAAWLWERRDSWHGVRRGQEPDGKPCREPELSSGVPADMSERSNRAMESL